MTPELQQIYEEAGKRVLERCKGKKVSKLQIREMTLEELKAVEAEMKAAQQSQQPPTTTPQQPNQDNPKE